MRVRVCGCVCAYVCVALCHDAKAAGGTMQIAVEEMLGNLPKTTIPPLQWVDRCNGFACGKGCFVDANE